MSGNQFVGGFVGGLPDERFLYSSLFIRPGTPMSPKYAKLAGLGAYGACAGMLALFGLLIFGTRHTLLGGLLPALSYVTWISLAVVFVALIGAHVAIGKQLMHIGKGGGATEV
jgi:hypothetical protein